MSRLKIICWLYCVLIIGHLQAIDQSDLLFYAPFDNELAPLDHAGVTFRESDSNNIVFVNGVLGQGIRAGDSDSLLRYPAAGNIDNEVGSISMWVRVLWVPTVRAGLMHSFLSIPGKLEYSFISAQWMHFLWHKGEQSRGLGGYPGPPFVHPDERDHWHHLVFTWDKEGRFISYYNGKFNLQTTSYAPWRNQLTPEDFFYLCDPKFTVDDHNRTEIDELMIFNRVLTPTEVKTLYRRPLAPTIQTVATIPAQRSEIRVDGDFDAGQWKNSLETTDFVDALFGDLYEDGVRLNITSDSEGVYLSLRDQKQLGDLKQDGWEIQIKPNDGSDVRHFNCSIAQASQLQSQPQHAWNVALKLTSDQTYCMEAFIPFSSIGLDGDVTNKTFEINVIRKYSGKRTRQLCWADIKKQNPYVKIRPSGDLTALKISRFQGLSNCQLDFAASVDVHSQPAAAQVSLQPSDRKEYYDPETMPGTKSYTGELLENEKEFADGQVSLKRSFDDTDINSVILKITDKKGATLYQTQKQFTCAAPLTLKFKLAPGRQLVTVASAILDKYLNVSDLKGVVCLYDSKGKLLDEAEMPKNAKSENTLVFSIAQFPRGETTIVGKLMIKNEEFFSYSTSFMMEDLNPEWIKNPAGVERRVTNVFTPIHFDQENKERKILLWGREYHFKDNLFPTKIVTQDSQLLAAPAQLKISAEGKLLEGGSIEWETQQCCDDQVNFTVTQVIGDFKLVTDNQVEFDGMVWTRMKIIPLKEGSTLEQAYLELPFALEASTLLHANSCNVSSPQFSGATPAQWSSGFKPVVWLGNERAGYCFFNESPVGWATETFYEIRRGAQQTLFRLNFVSRKVTLDAPLEISFGWFATPSRPLPENWLCWSYYGRPEIDYTATNMKVVTNDQCFDESNQFLHEAHPWEWFQKELHGNQQGKISLKYTSTRYLSFYKDWTQSALDHKRKLCSEYKVSYFETPESKFWSDEWKITPGRRELCTNTSFKDLISAGIAERIIKGKIDGIYFDCAFPMGCNHQEHGCSGRYDILSQREIRRRLTNVFEAEGKTSLVMEHMSDNILGPQISFDTLFLDGEHLSGGVTGKDYRQALPLERMRVLSIGTNLGVIPMMLYYGKKEEHDLADSYIAIWTLHMPIHGTAPMGGGWPIRLWEAFSVSDSFGYDKNTKRLGYWENADVISAGKEIKVTIYYKPGKALVIASNLTDDAVDSAINIDMAKIGLDQKQMKMGEYLKNQTQPPAYAEGVLSSPIRSNSCLMTVLEAN